MLSSITLPEGLKTLGNHAFVDCIGLTSLELPESLEEYGLLVFQGCSRLATVTMPTHFSLDFLFGSDVTAVKHVIIRDGKVTDLSGFQNLTALQSVTIQAPITSIQSFDFAGCSSLTEIMIPATVTEIKSYAFENCTSLTSISLGVNVTSIESHAFGGCVNLTDIYYSGTENQWNAIAVGNLQGTNAPFLEATVHYGHAIRSYGR